MQRQVGGPRELQLLYPLRTAFPFSPGTWLQAAAQSPFSALFLQARDG